MRRACHRARRALAAGLMLTGCYHGRPAPQRVRVDLSPTPGTSRTAPVDEPEILSAHLGVSDAPPLGGLDGLPVVFNVEVDAASLRPEVFWVSLENGDRVRAKEAILSPANEDDENRTVLVIGDFGSPTQNPPVAIAIYGNLYAEDGRALDGLAAEVIPFDTPGTIVAAERIAPGPGRCEGAGAAVRTYWIDGLRGVDNQDKARVRVTLDDGQTVVPDAFDDHDVAQQSAEDNVLDLCLPAAARAVQLRVEAGAFTDPPGHPSAVVDIAIGDAVTHDGAV